MNSTAIYNELDQTIDKILMGEFIAPAEIEPLVRELLPLAQDLRCFPSEAFQMRLLVELEDAATEVTHSDDVRELRPRGAVKPGTRAVVPTLVRDGNEAYPVRRANFVISAVLHVAAIAMFFTSGAWMIQRETKVKQASNFAITEISPYTPSVDKTKSGGGGGGGDRDKMAASKGDAPRFAREQITPPAIVVLNNDSKLQIEPTAVGPPDITLSKVGTTGDPLSNILRTTSNGTGTGGGIGSGAGGGVGSGYGLGVGPGYGGGYGGGVFRIGGGVSAPHAIYDPDPDYSEEARKAKFQGTVLLWIIVGADGRPRDIHVQRSLGMGLDEKAVEAVKKWKFAPATKDGQPVAVQVNVEVNFRLF